MDFIWLLAGTAFFAASCGLLQLFGFLREEG